MSQSLVEIESIITKVIKEIGDSQSLSEDVNSDLIPGTFIKSQVLIMAIGRISAMLDKPIPDDVYPFFDKKKRVQKSIKEVAQDLYEFSKK